LGGCRAGLGGCWGGGGGLGVLGDGVSGSLLLGGMLVGLLLGLGVGFFDEFGELAGVGGFYALLFEHLGEGHGGGGGLRAPGGDGGVDLGFGEESVLKEELFPELEFKRGDLHGGLQVLGIRRSWNERRCGDPSDG
jgi:hypothetical protein